jgi:mRNA interferase MazF
VRRGDVYWHRFRAPDKKRPVVVLTRSTLVEALHTVVVAQLTTTVRSVPSQVRVGPEDGLPRACAINLHHVFTLPKADLGPQLGSLGERVMARIDQALVYTLGVGETTGPLH